jgi:uncharacterized cupin superfamily protein
MSWAQTGDCVVEANARDGEQGMWLPVRANNGYSFVWPSVRLVNTDHRMLSADVMTEPLTADELSPSDVISGSPRVASADLETAGGVSIGIWEISQGAVTDTEVDEVFLVLAGSGEIAFDDGSTVMLAPGTLMRLRAGERTTWTITEPVRKVYVILPDVP